MDLALSAIQCAAYGIAMMAILLEPEPGRPASPQRNRLIRWLALLSVATCAVAHGAEAVVRLGSSII